MSAFVVNANTSAVTILLPTISEDVGAPVAQLQWAVTGYMLVGAAVIVTSGALGDVFGRRKVFLAGLLLFVASCVLIALSTSGAGVIAGRMIQGAAGSTILACGMSLLSVAVVRRRADAGDHALGRRVGGGRGAGPLIGGVLVDTHRLAGPVLDRRRDRRRVHPADARHGAGVARPEPVALDRLRRHGADRASSSFRSCSRSARAATGAGRRPRRSAASRSRCVGAVLFVVVERRVTAPLVDLALLRNQVLVGATLAILIVAGTINALMYVLSLYFQDPAAFGMSALEAGLATLPAAAAMIVDHAAHHAARGQDRHAARRSSLGFGLAAVGFAVLAFVESSWTYAAFVVPLVVLSVGLGLANGPASSASTAAVSPDQVGQASGISNMARYVGGSVFVAVVATIFNSVTVDRTDAGESTADALAAGLSRSTLLLAIFSALGIALSLLMARHYQAPPRAIDRAAAAAATHTRSRYRTPDAPGGRRQDAGRGPGISVPSALPEQ